MNARQSFRSLFASALALVAAGVISTPASADLCASTTNCTLNFTQGNAGSGFGIGNFGTLNLALSGNTVTVTIDLADNFYVISTGFPGAAGFSDSLAGLVNIGNFSSAFYSGGTSHAASDQHFDGFGDFNNAAATTAPSAGSANAVNVLSFTVTGATTAITDVEQLLVLANPVGGDGAAYFVVDVINRNSSGPGAGLTGLIAITGGGGGDLPEPATVTLLGLGLFSLALMRRYSRT